MTWDRQPAELTVGSRFDESRNVPASRLPDERITRPVDLRHSIRTPLPEWYESVVGIASPLFDAGNLRRRPRR